MYLNKVNKKNIPSTEEEAYPGFDHLLHKYGSVWSTGQCHEDHLLVWEWNSIWTWIHKLLALLWLFLTVMHPGPLWVAVIILTANGPSDTHRMYWKITELFNNYNRYFLFCINQWNRSERHWNLNIGFLWSIIESLLISWKLTVENEIMISESISITMCLFLGNSPPLPFLVLIL